MEPASTGKLQQVKRMSVSYCFSSFANVMQRMKCPVPIWLVASVQKTTFIFPHYLQNSGELVSLLPASHFSHRRGFVR